MFYVLDQSSRIVTRYSSPVVSNVHKWVFGREGRRRQVQWQILPTCACYHLNHEKTQEVVLQRDQRGGHSVNQHKQNGDILTWALLSWDYTSTTHWYELPNNQLTVCKTGLKLEVERLRVERHRNKYLLNSALSAHLQTCQHLVTQPYILHYLTAAKYYHLRAAVEQLSTVHCTYLRKKPDATSHLGHPPLPLLSNWGSPPGPYTLLYLLTSSDATKLLD